MEINPLPRHLAECERERLVPWDAPGLTIERLRLLGDAGYGWLDVSYCWGSLAGEPVRVQLPFDRLPRKRLYQHLYAYARRSGRFIAGLNSAVSILI